MTPLPPPGKLPGCDGRDDRGSLDLLDEPAVAVGVAEGEKRVVAGPFRIRAWGLTGRSEMEDLADVHAALHELGPGRVDVGDAEVEALERARRGHVFHRDDRAGRARWRELHDAKVGTGSVVNIAIEAGLLDIE